MKYMWRFCSVDKGRIRTKASMTYVLDWILRPHDDVIKWKKFPSYWPFVRGIHRSPANSPHKGQWRGALMFSLICARINGWVNNGEAGDLRRHRAHYDVIVMINPGDRQSYPGSHLNLWLWSVKRTILFVWIFLSLMLMFQLTYENN